MITKPTLQESLEIIRKWCREVLEANEKATPGPWRIAGYAGEHDECGADIRGFDGRRVAHTSGYHQVRNFSEDTSNAESVCLSRNFSPHAARALLALTYYDSPNLYSGREIQALIQMAEGLREGR